MHLGELQLGDGAGAGREGGVADDVAEGLSARSVSAPNPSRARETQTRHGESVPLGLVGLEGLALRVVADDLDVGVAPEVELLGPKHGHGGGGDSSSALSSGWSSSLRVAEVFCRWIVKCSSSANA